MLFLMIKCSSDNLFQPNKLLIEFLHAQNPGLYEFIPGLNIIHFSLKRPGYVDMILILLRRSPYQSAEPSYIHQVERAYCIYLSNKTNNFSYLQ